jgi:hypothetical protein
METLAFVSFDFKNPLHYDTLSVMLPDYFDETFTNNTKYRVPNYFIPKLIRIIADETSKYNEWLYFCKKENNFIGFSFFQIDTLDNPLYKSEGWGFIREFYIIPSKRRNGYAKKMCYFMENKYPRM